MKKQIVLESLQLNPGPEMAERKGTGHPDSICDHLAEALSTALCNYYLDEFGAVLHHNVDKALLVGGASESRFGGGKITEAIEIILSGRATSEADGKIIPINEIATTTAKKWLTENLRFLNPEKDVRIITKIRQGSSDLTELFRRFSTGAVPLANDTSFGMAYYPNNSIEQNAIKIERLLNSAAVKSQLPFLGEDIKVMAVNTGEKSVYTVSVAMIDRFITDIPDYIAKKEATAELIRKSLDLSDTALFINTADNYEKGSVYLTVSGTSAEAGDDGEVGRGNRINGLITPYRPMSLEAVAGKNPISHIGKIYNRFCLLLCKELVDSGMAEAAEAFIVSQIGKPINEPQLLHIKLKNCGDKKAALQFAESRLDNIGNLWKEMLGVGFELLF